MDLNFVLQNFADALNDLIQYAPGTTWQEKAAWLKEGLEDRGQSENAEELRSWLED